MVDDVIAFIFGVLGEMNFYLEESGPDSKFGPAGIDLDSLAVIALASRIEETYGVALADEDMERMAVVSVRDFAAEIARQAKPGVPADSPAS